MLQLKIARYLQCWVRQRPACVLGLLLNLLKPHCSPWAQKKECGHRKCRICCFTTYILQ